MIKSQRSVLVTGGAGFIGSHLVDRLIKEAWKVTVVDNFDPFYDAAIKRDNVSCHLNNPDFRLVEADIRNFDALRNKLTDEYDVIVHLAAKAGVRPSLQNPRCYQEVNVTGTQNLLELARQRDIKQFVFGSSSSVYGINPNVPWEEDSCVLQPISPYASTKVSGELLGHVYSHLYDIRFIALRLFTVYGPRQRPDLAMHKFARRIIKGESIPVYGDGTTRRDYTFVDDVINGLRAAIDYRRTDYETINIGSGAPVSLNEMIEVLEAALGQTAQRNHVPEQPGDVPKTWASIERAERLLNYTPETDLKTGLNQLAQWLYAKNERSEDPPEPGKQIPVETNPDWSV